MVGVRASARAGKWLCECACECTCRKARGLARAVGGACECAVRSSARASVREVCGLARAEQRRVLIPHGAKRHHLGIGGVHGRSLRRVVVWRAASPITPRAMLETCEIGALFVCLFVCLFHGIPEVCGGRRLTKEGPYATRRQAEAVLFVRRNPTPPFAG